MALVLLNTVLLLPLSSINKNQIELLDFLVSSKINTKIKQKFIFFKDFECFFAIFNLNNNVVAFVWVIFDQSGKIK